MAISETQIQPRRGRLALIMLLILICSVLAAWWLSAHRQSYNEAGEKIVGQIHQAGLSAFWKEETIQRYYMVTQDGKVLGWSAFFRTPDDSGGYDTLEVIMIARDNRWLGSWERSYLNHDATEGNYIAGYVAAGGPGIQIMADTSIEFKQGQVLVKQNGLSTLSGGKVPPNYLPEGTLPLAMRLIAQQKTQAYFKLIYNTDIPPAVAKGTIPQTRFGLANIRFKGAQKVTAGDSTVDAYEVALQRGVLGKEDVQVQYLDDNGIAVKIESGDAKHQIVSLQKLLVDFPDIAAAITAIAKSKNINYPLPTIEKQHLPTTIKAEKN